MTDHIDETKPVYNLKFTHATYRRGDIIIVLTWNMQTGKGALMLLPGGIRNRDDLERATPCVVEEDVAWKWSDQIGDPTHQAICGAQFACALGLPPTSGSLHRVIGIIQDHVGDLATIPPMTPDGETIVGEAFARDINTGQEIYKEIKEHV